MKKSLPSPVSLPLCRIYDEEGVPLLSLSIKISDTDTLHPRVLSYCQEMASHILGYCDTDLFPRLKHAYLSNSDPRRRFTHRRSFLRAVFSVEYHEKNLFLHRTITYIQGAFSQSKTDAAVFHAESGTLTPPAKKAKKRIRTNRHLLCEL